LQKGVDRRGEDAHNLVSLLHEQQRNERRKTLIVVSKAIFNKLTADKCGH
jgi:hypothetical protein